MRFLALLIGGLGLGLGFGLAAQPLPWWEAFMALLVALVLAVAVPGFLRRRARVAQLIRDERQAHDLSEARFSTIFNQDGTGVALTDAATGRWLRVNQQYARMLGYTPDELMRTSYRAITHPDDLVDDDAQMEALRAGRVVTFSLQKRMLHKSGAILWVNLTISPLWGAGGSSGSYIAVVQDITREKLAERQLGQNEQRLTRILDHLPVAVALVDGAERILYHNQRFETLLGHEPGQIRDVAGWWNLAYPDHERLWARQRWGALCAKARAGTGVIDATERTIRRADGTECVVKVGGALLDDGYLVMLEDMQEYRAAQERIQYLAYYDPLTRLPNSHALLERLQDLLVESLRLGSWGAILRVDVDRFRALNETRGRNYGDELLMQIAGKLLFYARRHLVARFGDDEFAVVLTNLASGPGEANVRAAHEAEALLNLLNVEYSVAGSSYFASVSIGIAQFPGNDVSADELLKRSGIAITQARGGEYGSYAFFDPNTQKSMNDRIQLEMNLRQALNRQDFRLHYQPQVRGGRIIGAEALLRWQHPAHGTVSPAAFIPVAEETGLILPLGDWVLGTACAALAAWSADPLLATLTLAVNVSPRQFYQSNFTKWVLGLVERMRIDPRRLKIEITEGVLVRDFDATIEKMTQLRQHGVGIALDDFGTGYSSLAYLTRLPIDEIKVDQKFVRSAQSNPGDAAIVRTVVTLGKSLGVRVLAEGVETEAQRAWLAACGCDEWQGFLMSRALPAPAFEVLARRVNQDLMTPGKDTGARAGTGVMAAAVQGR